MNRTLTQKLSSIKPDTILVGVDIGKKSNVATLIDKNGRRLGRVVFGNTRAEYEQFIERIESVRVRHQASEVLVGMEPTSYLWKLFAAYLEEQEKRYRLVNAYTVKKYREGMQLDRAKDDGRDSFFIADLLRIGKFTETQRLQGVYAELREYSVLYERLQKEERRQKTVLHSLVGQVFPELTEVFQCLTAQTARAMLLHHAGASDIRTLAEEDFIAEVRSDLTGKRLMVGKLRQAYRLAQESIGLDETEALQLSIRCCLTRFETNERLLEEARTALMDTFLSLPHAPFMLSLNLGMMTTAHIAAEIGDPYRYQQAKQWVKLAGIQPSPNSSGQRKGTTTMSKKGRSRLRTHLYFACLRLIQYDEAFALLYQHLQQRRQNPLTGAQAIGVLMNKTLHILWALVHQQTWYDPSYWQAQRALAPQPTA